MATAPKKQAEPATVNNSPLRTHQESPAPSKPMEVARSGPMDLRAMRQLASSMHATVRQFMGHNCVEGKTLETAKDTASEYNWILNEIDTFYAKARHGIGNVKIYLVAESEGFTKQMVVSVKEKDSEDGATTWELAK